MNNKKSRKEYSSSPKPTTMFDDLNDEMVTNISGFTGKSIPLNKYSYDQFSCTPTPTKYRVLKQIDQDCPLEAMYQENGTRCCTSSIETDDEIIKKERSRRYMTLLQRVSFGISPQNYALIPLKLKRILSWIKNLMSSEFTPVVSQEFASIKLDEDDEYIYDIVKLVLMTHSNTVVNLSTPLGISNIVKNKGRNKSFTIDPSYKTYKKFINILNDIGTEHVNAGLVDVGTKNVTKLPPLRAIAVDILDRGRQLFDINDIVEYFIEGNKREWEQESLKIGSGPRGVVKIKDKFDNFVFRLVKACHSGIIKNRERMIEVEFQNDDIVNTGEIDGYARVDVVSISSLADKLYDEMNGDSKYIIEESRFQITYPYVDVNGGNQKMEVVIEYKNSIFVMLMASN